uniref:restriction endonuclease subunit S n=1 Tax=Candidatus Electrothrix sp. TaxID=2170559 RepID=UPI00405683CB
MGTKKELVPRLRFPEFRDGGKWEARTLEKYTTKIGSGITPRGGDKNYKVEGRPFVRSQNIGWGELILDDIVYIDEATHSSFSSTEILANDVLLNISGASIGRSSIANELIAGGNVNQHVCIIRLKIKKLSPIFLNQFLLSQEGQKQIDSFQAGGNRQGLNFGQIGSFSIPFPDKLEEQQKIADCLSSLDALIAAQTEKIEILKTHKKGLMQQLFPLEGETVPRHRFPEFREAEQWKASHFGDLGVFTGGGTPSKSKPAYWQGDIPWVSSSDISDESIRTVTITRFITKQAIKKSATKLIPSGSILLVSRVGVGKLAIIESPVCTSQDFTNFTPSKDNPIFLGYYLKSNGQRLENLCQGMAIKGFTKEDISKMELFIPGGDEQQKIADCLSTLDELIVAQTEKLYVLKTHKKGLMQQLFPSPETMGV